MAVQQVYTPVTPAALGATIYSPALIAIWVQVGGALKIRGLKDTNPVTLPAVPSQAFLNLPYPAAEVIASAPLSGTVTLTNGSTLITFSVAQTLAQGAALVFSQQPGTVYYLASPVNGSTSGTLTSAYTGTSEPVTLTGTVTVTNGSTAVTFSVAQTLPAGQALIFSSQPGVVYNLASAISAGTAGTLTSNYTGTTSTTATTQTVSTVTEGTTASGLVGAQAGA